MTFLPFPVDFFSGACHYETVWLVRDTQTNRRPFSKCEHHRWIIISDDAILYVADSPRWIKSSPSFLHPSQTLFIDPKGAWQGVGWPESTRYENCSHSQRLFLILNLYDWYLAGRNPVQRWIGLTSRHPKWQELDFLHFLSFFCALFFKLIGSVCG